MLKGHFLHAGDVGAVRADTAVPTSAGRHQPVATPPPGLHLPAAGPELTQNGGERSKEEEGREEEPPVIGRAVERKRLSETGRTSELKSGICLFKFNHAALAELEMDGLRYEFLIRRLIGYEQGRNPIEEAFFLSKGKQ